MLLAKILSKIYKKDGIILIDAKKQKYICGNPNQNKPNHVKPNRTKPKQTTPNHTTPNQKTHPTKPNHTKPRQTKPNHDISPKMYLKIKVFKILSY